MTFPPSLVRLRVRTPEHAWPTLWLPLFLLWPLLLLMLVPLTLVAIVIDPRHTARTFQLAGTLLAVICALRGLLIDVVDSRTQVLISFH